MFEEGPLRTYKNLFIVALTFPFDFPFPLIFIPRNACELLLLLLWDLENGRGVGDLSTIRMEILLDLYLKPYSQWWGLILKFHCSFSYLCVLIFHVERFSYSCVIYSGKTRRIFFFFFILLWYGLEFFPLLIFFSLCSWFCVYALSPLVTLCKCFSFAHNYVYALILPTGVCFMIHLLIFSFSHNLFAHNFIYAHII